MMWWMVMPAALAVLLGVVLLRRHQLESGTSAREVHVVLVGASIGQAWRLSEWPARAGQAGISAEAVAAWQFDKTAAVSEVLMRPATPFRLTRTWLHSLYHPPRKADVVILKECSSYFPGNLEAYRQHMQRWIQQLSEHRVKVVLATVVPVTRERDRRDPGKQESLLAFNRWIREFGAARAIPLLDLESALRSDDRGYLGEEYAADDGSHLNSAAYAVLDRFLVALVREHDLAPAGPAVAVHAERP